MKTGAVICEYNPFHKGHKKLFGFIKDKAGYDFIICIMSGNFVQRGEPAIFDKFTRTRMALLNGADLVVEQPLIFACSSSREFASCGVNLALKTGIVNTLFFGIEKNMTLEKLKSTSSSSEMAEKDPYFTDFIKRGLTYPEVTAHIAGIDPESDLVLPNNILAAEYLKALAKFDKKRYINAFPVKIDNKLSASLIRKVIYKNGAKELKEIKDQIPESIFEIYDNLMKNNKYVHKIINPPSSSTSRFSAIDRLGYILRLRLLEAKYFNARPLSEYLDVSHEITGRLLKYADKDLTFDEMIMQVKTRQYTYTRISRALLHIILGITQAEFEERKAKGYVSNIRILGFSRKAVTGGLLKALKKNASLNIITKLDTDEKFISKDLFRDQLYYSLIPGEAKSEFTYSPIVV